MHHNVGTPDRAIRLVLGLGLIMMPLVNLFGIWNSAALAFPVMAIGVILTLTAITGFCLLYKVLGISTRHT